MSDPQESLSKSEEKPTEREYEQSGLYPKEGKAFHLWGLLGSLAGVIVLIAVSAIILDRILI